MDRLRTTGFYLGEFFANHGPRAAEALAKLGYCDEVNGWLEANIRHHDYRPLPDPTQRITEPARGGDLDTAAVDLALSDLTAEYAGHYTATMASPLIHTITAPAAIRLLLAELPAELHATAFARSSRSIENYSPVSAGSRP